MSHYKTPDFLNERYPEFHQRYHLRNQFELILHLMESNEKKLASSQNIEARKLLQEIKAFKIWSWKEADRDDHFYTKIKEFDKNTFLLLNQY